MNAKLALILIVILLGIFLRFYQLGTIPNGIDSDEASLGYDAYSILQTGKDRYGEAFPIFLRSFGNYQSPLYAYLTIIPIWIFDLSVFATRFISALSGIIILICSFFLILNTRHPKRFEIATFATLFIAISPWAILFSRTAVEANLGLAIFALSILLFVLSINYQRWLFILACMFLALSTYAYHAERLIAILFLGFSILLFRKKLLANKKILLIGIIIFFVIQIPQFLLINSPASKSRISQVQYLSNDFFEQNDTDFKTIPFGKQLFIARKFLSQYTSYFSPDNLFFEPDVQEIRSMPDLSIFYPWMIIPFIFGIRELIKKRKDTIVKLLFLVLIISPLPASITKEPFYTLRALPLFWAMTIMIGFGMYFIFDNLRGAYLKYIATLGLIFLSVVLLYNSFFILLKYERMQGYGYYNMELIKKLEEFKNSNIIVDSSRMNLGRWLYFAKKYDPHKAQIELAHYVEKGYYLSTEFDDEYKIDNIEIRPLSFKNACNGNILVGDLLSISEAQVKEHKLTTLFEIKDLNNKTIFKGYATDPNIKC